jgi:1-phosphofructokinase family hexose kinase
MANLLALTPNPAIDIMMEVPLLRVGEVHRATSVRKMAGGKGLNVARVARALGQHVEVGGFLGGSTGRFAQGQYEADGLRGHYVWFEGETRECILVNEPDGRSTVINENGGPVTPEHVAAFAAQIRQIRDNFQWISLSGSVQPGAPPEAYAEVIEAMRPARIAIDTHGKVLELAARCNPDLLRINGHEAAALLGRPVDNVEAALAACVELHGWGSQLVAISMGEKGAVGYDGTEAWHGSTPPITVVSNIGAGDGMLAGVLAGLMEERPFAEALAMGVASGATCCTIQAPGTLPLETYRQLLPQVKLVALT